MLTEDIKKFIKNDALISEPNECCGLILKNNSVIKCTNISKAPEISFIIPNNEIFKYGLDNIIGFYHSHKNTNEFSLADIYFSEKSKKDCILYCIEKDTFNIYTPNGFEIPYEGRPIFYGTLDCFTLFEDYYKRELNIKFDKTITDDIRFNEQYWEKRLLERPESSCINNAFNFLLNNGFSIVKDLKRHDVLELQSDKFNFSITMAIYLGGNKILTYVNGISSITAYSKAHKRVTRNIYRHNSLL